MKKNNVKTNKSKKENNKFTIEKIKKLMNGKNKIKIIGIVVVLIIVIIGIFLAIDYYKDKKVLEKSSIDLSSETYKGKKVKVKGNQIIIYEENGSKTIETVNNDKEEMKKATEKIKDQFSISNISISKEAAKMLVSGKIKAKTDEYSKVVISAKFYRDGKIASTSSNTIENVKKNKEYDFSMNFVGDYSDCTSKVEVEYVK